MQFISYVKFGFIAKYNGTVAMADIFTLAMYQNFSLYNNLQEITCIHFIL